MGLGRRENFLLEVNSYGSSGLGSMVNIWSGLCSSRGEGRVRISVGSRMGRWEGIVEGIF